MTRQLLVPVLLAACVCMRPVLALPEAAPDMQAAAQAGQAPVDRALASQFVAADATERTAMITAHPAIIERAFREWLVSEGTRLRMAGDLATAERHFRAAIHIGERHNLPATVVGALNGLVPLAAATGDLARARQFADDALALATATNSLPGQQASLANLAIVQRRSGDLDGALATQKRALELARQVGEPLPIARALHNVGLVTQNMGNSAKALEYYIESLAMKTRSNGSSNDFVVTLTVIGTIYAEEGEYELAASYYQRAIDAGGQEITANVAGAYNNLGQTQVATGKLAEAKKTFERALPLAQQTRNRSAEATMVYNLGIIARSEDRFADAEALQRRSLAIREQLAEPLGLSESLTEISNLLTRLSRAEESLPYAERAVKLAADSRLLNQLWKAQLTTGHTYARLGRNDEARRFYEGAIQTIETLRVLAAGGDGGARMMSERLGPFYGLAALDVGAGRTFSALATIDRGRARALIDIISTRPAPARLESEAQRAGERQITDAVLRAAALADAEIRKPQPDRARLAVLEADVTAARIRREAFLAELYASQPDLRLARGGTPDITTSQLMTVLTRGTAIVSFVLDTEAVWAYVATRGAEGPEVTAHALPMPHETLIALTDRFSHQVSSRDLSFAGTARAAYDALFGAVEPRLAGISRVIVIPDGPLWRLPFQALRTPRGRFLIEERAVSYTPSIAALVALDQRRREQPATTPFLLALGDPAIAAPIAKAGAGEEPQRGLPTRLPEAAREVRSLGRLYGAARSAVLVDAAATEAALRKESSRATVLHVATHGVLDNANPMYSHLLLAPGGGKSADDDGRLEAWEVMGMGITADIAVLSACQTARGGPGFGEGIMGLSWSLFASGASTTVVSQWEVDSASTTSLMIGFHQQLLGSRNGTIGAPEALRQAAIALMKDPDFRHPFYWAGFISVGAK